MEDRMLFNLLTIMFFFCVGIVIGIILALILKNGIIDKRKLERELQEMKEKHAEALNSWARERSKNESVLGNMKAKSEQKISELSKRNELLENQLVNLEKTVLNFTMVPSSEFLCKDKKEFYNELVQVDELYSNAQINYFQNEIAFLRKNHYPKDEDIFVEKSILSPEFLINSTVTVEDKKYKYAEMVFTEKFLNFLSENNLKLCSYTIEFKNGFTMAYHHISFINDDYYSTNQLSTITCSKEKMKALKYAYWHMGYIFNGYITCFKTEKRNILEDYLIFKDESLKPIMEVRSSPFLNDDVSDIVVKIIKKV